MQGSYSLTSLHHIMSTLFTNLCNGMNGAVQKTCSKLEDIL